MNYMLSHESLSAAKKVVKMIAKTIVEGLMKDELVIKFEFEYEVIEMFHHSLDDGRISLSVYRDNVSSYIIYGTPDLDGVKEMASDIFFLLALPYFNVKI